MPSLALALSLFVLSQSALLVKLAHASALEIGLWRMVMALPILLILNIKNLRELGQLRPRRLGALALCGLCLYAHWFTWFLSVQKTALANAMVLFAVSPLFTAVGAWAFFREPFTKRHGIALALCLAGVVLVFRDSLHFEPARLEGDILGLLASLLFSAYVLMGKGIRRDLKNLPFTIVTYSSCAVFFALTLGFQGGLHAQFDRQTWWMFALLAIGPTLLGHALFTYCLQFFNVNLMNILILTEPVLGSVVAYFVLREPITSGVLLGFLTISAGVLSLFLPALAQARARQRPRAGVS